MIDESDTRTAELCLDPPRAPSPISADVALALWRGVLADGIVSATSDRSPAGDADRAWIASDDDHVGSFAWTCDACGMDHAVVRTALAVRIAASTIPRERVASSVRAVAAVLGVSPATAHRRAQASAEPLSLLDGVLQERRMRRCA